MEKHVKPAWLQQDKDYYMAIKSNIEQLVYHALFNGYQKKHMLPGLSICSIDETDLLYECLIEGFISGFRQYLDDNYDFWQGLSINGILIKIGFDEKWKDNKDNYRNTLFERACQAAEDVIEKGKQVASDSEIIYAIEGLKAYRGVSRSSITSQMLITTLETILEGKKVVIERLRGICKKHKIILPANDKDDVCFEDSFWEQDVTEKKGRKIKILFLSADPSSKNKCRLLLDNEAREVQDKIRQSTYRDSLDFQTRWAVRVDDVILALNEVNPEIVHFSGHGSKKGEIILVDSTGKANPIELDGLKKLFETMKGNIRVVFLNACYSEIQAKAISEHIECCIGMNNSVEDATAIEFSAIFYRAIGFGKSIKNAFEQGVVSLTLNNMPDKTCPVLICKDNCNPDSVVLL